MYPLADANVPLVFQLVQLIAKKRPELKSRLPSLVGEEPNTNPIARVDTSLAENELGINFISLEKSLLDTVDSLVGKESEW